ncbi:MAG: hypothetical protein PHS73_01445, partial [Candidatus Peribacteraceae bacterium]|nr:hypothetical protein [Candidatus Peribacteraceae bacterium]
MAIFTSLSGARAFTLAESRLIYDARGEAPKQTEQPKDAKPAPTETGPALEKPTGEQAGKGAANRQENAADQLAQEKGRTKGQKAGIPSTSPAVPEATRSVTGDKKATKEKPAGAPTGTPKGPEKPKVPATTPQPPEGGKPPPERVKGQPQTNMDMLMDQMDQATAMMEDGKAIAEIPGRENEGKMKQFAAAIMALGIVIQMIVMALKGELMKKPKEEGGEGADKGPEGKAAEAGSSSPEAGAGKDIENKIKEKKQVMTPENIQEAAKDTSKEYGEALDTNTKEAGKTAKSIEEKNGKQRALRNVDIPNAEKALREVQNNKESKPEDVAKAKTNLDNLRKEADETIPEDIKKLEAKQEQLGGEKKTLEKKQAYATAIAEKMKEVSPLYKKIEGMITEKIGKAFKSMSLDLHGNITLEAGTPEDAVAIQSRLKSVAALTPDGKGVIGNMQQIMEALKTLPAAPPAAAGQKPEAAPIKPAAAPATAPVSDKSEEPKKTEKIAEPEGLSLRLGKIEAMLSSIEHREQSSMKDAEAARKETGLFGKFHRFLTLSDPYELVIRRSKQTISTIARLRETLLSEIKSEMEQGDRADKEKVADLLDRLEGNIRTFNKVDFSLNKAFDVEQDAITVTRDVGIAAATLPAALVGGTVSAGVHGAARLGALQAAKTTLLASGAMNAEDVQRGVKTIREAVADTAVDTTTAAIAGAAIGAAAAKGGEIIKKAVTSRSTASSAAEESAEALGARARATAGGNSKTGPRPSSETNSNPRSASASRGPDEAPKGQHANPQRNPGDQRGSSETASPRFRGRAMDARHGVDRLDPTL